MAAVQMFAKYFLLLMIMDAWIGQVKFGTDLNFNFFTNYKQNNFF
jgi:hypothetical protein